MQQNRARSSTGMQKRGDIAKIISLGRRLTLDIQIGISCQDK